VRRSRFPLTVTLAVLAFFYLPIVVLVVNSFNASRFGATWEGWSLHWYARLLSERAIWQALENSLIIAATATLVSTLLGTVSALALHRYDTRLQQAHSALLAIPLVMPEILMGISLLLFFVATGVELGLFTVFLAHVTFCTSFVALVVLGRLQDFDESLIEAARDLGASWWTVTWRVLAPLLAPGIVAGALLAFTLSIDDFVVTFFVAGPGATTLPIRIYGMIKHGSLPLINALSTVLLAITFAAVWLSQRLTEDRT
jgi:spermidine/putrescine transport system permease protein